MIERARELDQSHYRILTAPVRDQTLVLAYWRWLELRMQFLGKPQLRDNQPAGPHSLLLAADDNSLWLAKESFPYPAIGES